MRLVVCDGNRILSEALSGALEACGHEVLAAASTAEECIAAVAAYQPDVCELDLQLPGPDDGATLGIIYISEPAAPMLGSLVRELAAGTGIASWVGGVGLGVCAAGQEVYDRPAVAVMAAAVPGDSFRLFGATDDPAKDLPRQHARWIETAQPTLALVHADPRCTDLMQAAIDTASASGAFLVGGLVSHRCTAPLVAGGSGPDALGKAGISGLLLGPEVAVLDARTAPEGFDARRSATSRRYRYLLLVSRSPDPLLRILHHLLPLTDPTDCTRHREQGGEHAGREAHRLQDDA